MLDGQRERSGDYVFTANTVGEYSFCFENDMSTLTDKLVDFDIMVESEPRREVAAKPGQMSDHSSPLEESVYRLNSMLMSIKRTQRQWVPLCLSIYPLTPCQFPHARNPWLFIGEKHSEVWHLIKSCAWLIVLFTSRLFWYAVCESIAVVGMAVCVLEFNHCLSH